MIALVTGASSGIGRGLALTAGKHGFDVIVSARSADKLSVVADEIRAMGVRVDVILADLSEANAPELLADTALAIGPVDILINAAGFGTYRTFTELPWDTGREMLGVNIVALTELTRRILPSMVQRRSGRVMNLASTAGFQPTPGLAVYAASKAYVLHFTEAVREELIGSGVTVTAVCPGPTDTGFHAVAGTGTALISRYLGMKSEPVVEAAWNGMMAGTAVVVPGWFNTLNGWTIGSFPRLWARKMAGVAMKPR